MSNNSVIVIRCSCGETFYSARRHVGKNIICNCGNTLLIYQPPIASEHSRAKTVEFKYRDERKSNGKSFLGKVPVKIGAGIACFVIGSIIFYAAYRLFNAPANNQTAASVQTTPEKLDDQAETVGTLPIDNPIPEKPKREPVSLANGAIIAPPQGARGKRYLEVINDFDSDVAVKLIEISTGKTQRFFYVRANSRFTVRGIGKEEYVLRFSSGSDWDAEMRKFLVNASYGEFEKSFDFRRTNYQAKLKPSIYGNSKVDSIGEAAFADK